MASRVNVARSFTIDLEQLTAWVHIADLFRIHGLGDQHMRLLIASGITSTALLTSFSAERLHEKMTLANNAQQVVRQLPRVTTIGEWVTSASNLAKRVD